MKAHVRKIGTTALATVLSLAITSTSFAYVVTEGERVENLENGMLMYEENYSDYASPPPSKFWIM